MAKLFKFEEGQIKNNINTKTQTDNIGYAVVD